MRQVQVKSVLGGTTRLGSRHKGISLRQLSLGRGITDSVISVRRGSYQRRIVKEPTTKR